MSDDPARTFADALGRKDAAALKAVLHPDIDFKALTPRRLFEASSPDQVVDEIVLGTWFDPGDHIDEVLSVDTDDVVDRHRLAYRLKVTNSDGPHIVEQQAYLEHDGERITWMRVLCAGYQPVTG